MANMKRVEVGWEFLGEAFRVVCNIGPRVAPTFEDPGDPGELEILEVREDAPGGAARPDLLEAAQKDFDRIGERVNDELAEAWS